MQFTVNRVISGSITLNMLPIAESDEDDGGKVC